MKKSEAIKCIKEDFGVLGLVDEVDIIRKWMKRFNIKEDDLR